MLLRRCETAPIKTSVQPFTLLSSGDHHWLGSGAPQSTSRSGLPLRREPAFEAFCAGSPSCYFAGGAVIELHSWSNNALHSVQYPPMSGPW